MAKKKNTIRLEVVTPAGVTYNEDIEALEAPAVDGLIGIWARHAPLVTALKTGLLKVKAVDTELSIPVDSGFMEVKPDIINVVVQKAILPDNIDLEEARTAREKAEEIIQNNDEDREQAEEDLEWAEARIEAAENYSGI